MNKEKPILLFFENLVEPIQNTKAEFELIENDIDLLNREFLLKGVFAYAFARFESSLSDCLKRYLNEIPSKLLLVNCHDIVDIKSCHDIVDGNAL